MCKLVIYHDGCNCPPLVTYEPCFLWKRENLALVTAAWRNRSWIERLFNQPPREPRQLLHIDCPIPAAVAHSSRACPECAKRRLLQVEEEERKEKKRDSRNRHAEKRMVEARWRVNEATWRGGEGELSSVLAEAKAAYLCISCLQKKRHPDRKQRAANGGFCCSRGMDEWEEAFGEKLARKRFEARHLTSKARSVDVRTPQMNIPPDGFPPNSQSATYYPAMNENGSSSPRYSMATFPQALSAMGVPGINEREWNTQVQTGHGTIPRPSGGQLPPTPARSTRDFPQIGSSPPIPSRPTNLPTPDKRLLPDVPNFKPGISDTKNKTRGPGKKRALPEPSPSSNERPQPKLIKAEIHRNHTILAVRHDPHAISLAETEPKPRGTFLNGRDAIRKGKTLDVRGTPNGSSSSKSERPFSPRWVESLSSSSTQPLPSSPARIVPYGSLVEVMDETSSSNSQRPQSSSLIARRDIPPSSPSGSKQSQPSRVPPTQIPIASSSSLRKQQPAPLAMQRPLPQSPTPTSRQPKPSSSTTSKALPRQPSANTRQPSPSPPSLNKTLPPFPSPHYPTQPLMHYSPSSTRTPNPRSLLSSSSSSSYPREPNQRSSSVRATPSSSTNSRRPHQGASSIGMNPSSLIGTTLSTNPRYPHQGSFLLPTKSSPTSESKPQNDPSSPKSRAQKTIPSSTPPKPQSTKRSPSSTLRSRSISPVSSTNSRWEEVLSSTPQPSPESRQRSPSPLSPLSTPRMVSPAYPPPPLRDMRRGGPPSLTHFRSQRSEGRTRSGETKENQRTHAQVGEVHTSRDQARPQVESETIQSRRQHRGVMTTVDDVLEDALAAWSGPDAMTRAEREEKKRKEGNH